MVYFEVYSTAEDALKREKQIKRYRRQWKENLINSVNPQWRDLYDDFKEQNIDKK
ncbi:hypothetical protein C900_00288 [Fulvivirga imtechensis AK7]|uniref:GIY-YIG domain-containing protein n=1 Tax=Fulvivirga imtechensis AK7 TaxID=1237149 RepID=L8JMC9_9BACT|nr:hypothetical protein C900_00288 [Fulvivirga imtechensis AK7]